MSIYDVIEIEKQIEMLAEENEGEIPEEKLQELVEAQTNSLASVEKLCRYIRHLELYQEICKLEEDRIKNQRLKSKARIESVKKYLTPYVAQQGKFDAGTFKLSVRKSKRVELVPGFKHKDFTEVVTTFKHDKNMIKKAIENGENIPGAELQEYQNLQLK